MHNIYANHPDRLILTAEADALAALAAVKAAEAAGTLSDAIVETHCDRQEAADSAVFTTKPRTLAGAAAVLRRVLCPRVGAIPLAPTEDEWIEGLRNVLALLEEESVARVRAAEVGRLPVPLHRVCDHLNNLVRAAQALHLAIEGIAADDIDTRAHGLLALGGHVAAMAEAIAAAVGDRAPDWNVAEARLNTFVAPDIEAEGESAAGGVA